MNTTKGLQYMTRDRIYKLYLDGMIDKQEAEAAMNCTLRFYRVCRNNGK